MTRRKVLFSLSLLMLMTSLGCPEPAVVTRDASGSVACVQDNDCPSGQSCHNQTCVANMLIDAGVDASNAEAGQTGDASSGTDTAVSGGQLQVEPNDLYLEFGGVRLGSQVDQMVTLRNVGGGSLRIFQIALRDNTSGEFSASPSGSVSLDLAPGQDMQVTVTHTAIDGQADTAYLSIVSSDEAQSLVEVELFAEFKGEPQLVVVEDRSIETPETSSLDFGQVPVGSSIQRTVYLKNLGANDSVLSISSVTREPGSVTAFSVSPSAVPKDLSRDLGACSDAPSCGGEGRTCVAGICYEGSQPLDLVVVNINFSPTSAADYDAELVIVHNGAGESGSRSIPLIGSGVSGELVVTPGSLSFSKTFVGFPQDKIVTVSNTGSGSLDLTDLSLLTGGLGFSLILDDTLTTLAGGANTEIVVRFDPSAAALALVDVLSISTSAQSAAPSTVTLVGNAYDPPEIQVDPENIAFGDVHVRVDGLHLPGQQTVQVTNNGPGALTLSGAQFYRPASATIPHGLTVQMPSSSVIDPGGNAAIALDFEPESTGDLPADLQLRITSDDPHDGRSVLYLDTTGRGINPDLVLTPSSVNFAPTLAGTQRDVTISVANQGPFGPLLVNEPTWQNMDRGGVFSVLAPTDGWPLVINSNAATTLTLRYSPPSDTDSPDTATLIFVSNDIETSPTSFVVTGSSTSCPPKTGADGLYNSVSGECEYWCLSGQYDLDGDLQQEGGSCEYACSGDTDAVDLPDSDDDGVFDDLNCDGIDGDLENSVFVATNGDPGNSGAWGSPLNTISAGIAKAQAESKTAVLVAAGVYSGQIDLVNGVSVFGGYAADFRSRSYSNLSIVQRSVSAQNMIGVMADGIVSDTTVDGLYIAVSNNGTSGGSTYGVYAKDSSSNLKLSNLNVVAGSGGAGTGGTPGDRGDDGSPGDPGTSGGDGSSCCGYGGAGGSSTCDNPGGAGGRGGYASANGDSGISGTGANYGGGGSGGEADTSTCGWCDRAGSGGNGLIGDSLDGIADPGNSGSGGSEGSILSGFWVSSNGVDGDPGKNGAGGGGGGGGGGSGGCTTDGGSDRGGGGGGGGGGGCGGKPGSKGTGGGGSFGIFLNLASPSIRYCSINSSSGGSGGKGAVGGAGGNGGIGGSFGAAADEGGQGGSGGKGGAGGKGGCGGGGAGGPSYAIYRYNNSNPSTLMNTLSYGSGGAGGDKGSSSCPEDSAGSAGAAGETYP